MEKHKILIVDDNLKLLKLGQAIFETGGYEVVIAHDGVEALQVLPNHNIALIITDILMPNMDGYSLCYHLRNDDECKKIPVIIYSATYTSQIDEKLAIDIGADLFIRKPAAMQVLLDAAKSLINIPQAADHPTTEQDLAGVMRQYSSRLIDKLEDKNTKLEKAHVDLIKSEKYFKALIENIFDAISLHNEAGEILYQSPATERITGYTLAEAKTMNVAQFFHPDDMQETMKRLQNVQSNPGKPIYGIRRMRHKDGHYIWTEGTSTNLLHDENVNAIVANFRDITERKQAEEKILHANRLYSFISQINQTIVHSKDEQTVFDKACRTAIEHGKFKVALIRMVDKADRKLRIVAQQGLSDADAVKHAEIYYDINEPFSYTMETGRAFISNDLGLKPVKSEMLARTIEMGWLSAMILPIKKEGEIYAVYVVISGEKDFFDSAEVALLEEAASDISFALGIFEKEKHRRLIEEKLENSEYHLKQAQSMAHVGSWEFDFKTETFLWSDETCRIYGISPEQNTQTYRSWMSFIHPDDTESVAQVTKEGNLTFTSFSFHHRIIRPDGTIRYIFSQADFEFDSKGEATVLYGIAHDLTEIKEAENALMRSEANLRLIMNLMPQCISTRDLQGNYLFVNNSFADLYQLTPDQLIGKNLLDMMPVRTEAQHFIDQDKSIIESGQKRVMTEYSITDYNGQLKYFNTTKVPINSATTNEKGILSITADVTEQKKAEEERARMVADIVQRNKDLEQFSYIVSHNLRAPVANITGLTEILEIPGITMEDKAGIIKDLAESVRKLDDVIMDLNYILQIRKNDTSKNEAIIFSKLCEDIKYSITNLINHDDVLILCDFSAVDEIISFRSYLYSIFLNLITNSIKYRKENVSPIINIVSSRANNKIVIEFTDNGMGIDLEKNGNQVFGLYKRFHNHVQGKGMGLFMVKTQVESLGGKISVESEKGIGSTFKIEFEKNN
ncbi:MAG: PAS domain S-box protein [Flavipsychrobacter sp.]|nr:PAS domain S-box protein [Flavipsychrobacter sp.]